MHILLGLKYFHGYFSTPKNQGFFFFFLQESQLIHKIIFEMHSNIAYVIFKQGGSSELQSSQLFCTYFEEM